MTERIACAALCLPAGGVVTVDPPQRHYHVFEEARRQGHLFAEIRGAEEGYLTNHGRFVGRREGAIIADEIGQRKSRMGSGEVLLAEELW
jgi:hypothetical protein